MLKVKFYFFFNPISHEAEAGRFGLQSEFQDKKQKLFLKILKRKMCVNKLLLFYGYERVGTKYINATENFFISVQAVKKLEVL